MNWLCAHSDGFPGSSEKVAGTEANIALHRAQTYGSENMSVFEDPPVVKPPKIILDNDHLSHNEPAAFSHAPIAIAIDPVALVTTECITVTSAMRKHARWAQSSVSAILGGSNYRNETINTSGPKAPKAPSRRSSSRLSLSEAHVSSEDDALTHRWGLRGKRGKSLQDNPLMSAFARLRSDVKECRGMLLVQVAPARLTRNRYQNI